MNETYPKIAWSVVFYANKSLRGKVERTSAQSGNQMALGVAGVFILILAKDKVTLSLAG